MMRECFAEIQDKQRASKVQHGSTLTLAVEGQLTRAPRRGWKRN